MEKKEEEEEEKEEEEEEGVKESRYNHVYSDRFQNFLGEVRMLRELNHPNICLLMGTCFVAQVNFCSFFFFRLFF